MPISLKELSNENSQEKSNENSQANSSLIPALESLKLELEMCLDNAGLDQEQRDMFWCILENIKYGDIHTGYSNW